MNRRIPFLMAAFLALFSLSSCSYKLGNNLGGTETAGLRSIYVPVVKMYAYEPEMAVTITDAIIQRFHSDGTLVVRREAEADATLEVEVREVRRSALRSVRGDSRLVGEYRISLIALVTLKRKDSPLPRIKRDEVSGSTEFFVGQNLQESERQALGLAANDLAYSVVARVTEGWPATPVAADDGVATTPATGAATKMDAPANGAPDVRSASTDDTPVVEAPTNAADAAAAKPELPR